MPPSGGSQRGTQYAFGLQRVAWFDREVHRWTPLVEAVVWWMLLFAGYLALVSPLSGGELILGALLSVVAGCAGVLAHRASSSSFAVSWRWLGPLVRLPVAVLVDTLLLAWLLGQRWRSRDSPTGEIRTLPLTPQSDEVREESWQAVAGLLLSLSPGSFVLDSNGQPPRLLVHVLRGQPSALERSVHR